MGCCPLLPINPRTLSCSIRSLAILSSLIRATLSAEPDVDDLDLGSRFCPKASLSRACCITSSGSSLSSHDLFFRVSFLDVLCTPSLAYHGSGSALTSRQDLGEGAADPTHTLCKIHRRLSVLRLLFLLLLGFDFSVACAATCGLTSTGKHETRPLRHKGTSRGQGDKRTPLSIEAQKLICRPEKILVSSVAAPCSDNPGSRWFTCSLFPSDRTFARNAVSLFSFS